MTSSECSTCGKSKAKYDCRECNVSLCKDCARFVADDKFSFLEPLPQNQRGGTYCEPCHDAVILPMEAEYEAMMERAKQIDVYFSDQGKENRRVRRTDFKFKVQDVEERDEAVLRLAFFAAQAGFNTILDVEVKSVKKGERTYKYLRWDASGTAANMTVKKR